MTNNPVINDLRVINLHFEYGEGEAYVTPRGRVSGGVCSLVEVTLDNGLKGLGPVYTHPELLKIIVEQQFAPFLIGKDPTDIDAHWQAMYMLTRWYGRRGIAITAIGGVDNALWDLRGKLEDKRVSELLGGTRTSIPAYASGLTWQYDLDILTELARGFVSENYRYMKMRTGVNPDYDKAAFLAIKEGCDGKAEILVDCASRYTPDVATTMVEFLGEQGAYLIEEPFMAEEIDAYAKLASTSPIPVAAGEHETSIDGFRELFDAGAINIAQPDVSRCGGVTEVRRIAELAERYNIAIITHTWSDAASVLGNAQVVTAVPNGRMVEINRVDSPLIHDLLASPLTLDENGELPLPDAPGLGIVLADDAIERLAVPSDRPFPQGHYSDLTFGGEFDWTYPAYPIPQILERPATV